MSSLAEVEQARQRHEQAEQALKNEMHAAIQAGIPKSAVARAAGVSRNTLLAWMKAHQPPI